ncbi:MAG TPA: TonB-dependent receptor [Novosphingobium sp.]|nr:TonB-dependent receptor [Novosphingobium sp.]
MKVFGLKAGASLLALSALMLPQIGRAEEAQPAAADIIVTGTRVKGVHAADSTAPVQIVGASTFEKVGQADLTQGLQQNLPSFTAQSLGGDTGNFTLSAALRGLSPNHTLVLVNGKRRHPTANLQASPGSGLYQGAASVDLNLIPVSAIDHVEVLQDGAAAQYGTDAIAGVINIILKKGTQGGSFTSTIGQYYKGDGKSGDVQLNYGFKLGANGYFNVTGEARLHDYSQVGGMDYRAVNPDGTVKSGLSALNAAGVAGASGFPYVNKAIGDALYRVYNVMFNAGYDLGGGTQLYSFGSYSHRYGSAYQNYRLPSAVTKTVDGQTTALYPNGFSPREAFYEDDFSITGGLRGDLAGWSWDVSSTYGRNMASIWTRDSANASLYADTGSTPTNFYDGRFSASQWTTNLDLSRKVEIGLAGPLNIAGGAEYRRDTYAIGQGDAASIYKEGGQGFPGFQPSDAATHARSNVAGYIDLAAEIVKGLRTDLAGRIEHYSDFGTTAVWKANARYDFSPAFALRGTVSTGYRAPTLAEQYYSATTLTPNYAIVQLPVNSAAAAAAGFSQLKPEKSRNLSFGAIIHPAPNLVITIDAYQTIIRNRILATGYLLGQVGSTVVSQGVLDAISQHGNVLGPNLGYVAMMLFTNAADTRTRGLDATVTYDSALGDWGRANWSLGLNLNRTELLNQAPLPAAVTSTAFGQTALLSPAAISTITNSTPRWRLTPAVLITHGRLSVNLRENIYGPVSGLASLDGTGINGLLIKVPVSAITDIDVSYRLTPRVTLSAGANNLFNRQATTIPDVSDGAGGVQPASGTYNYRTPVLYSPYSINGGYYYAKLKVDF